ncbi:DNA adenine methylase [Chitinophaga sp. Cy-1792]|uniref:DNA adenine methylase n=1 Tax=Chitinophaga sp. Cy-1792 TaxID=2608339 RepID=UPI001420F1EC|nr:DNA adenine methylase [Chitinophaga sp. Cy-1792]NIG55031.1 DNA adenine methylase [Chitinophaga sp. Cy-1792]
MNNTPLRYPGGKTLMSSFIKDVLNCNGMTGSLYAEPYAGGAGAAINLLLEGSVDRIAINDASIGIYSFWQYIISDTKRFIKKIGETPINLEQWQIQRQIFKKSEAPSFELAFATFFLSRTNRSGILAAGPIGGQSPEGQEKANYKIDCRFNKDFLIEKINCISKFSNKIAVSNLDALAFLKKIKTTNALVYLDPPYYKQGKALYLDYYKHESHVELSNYLKKNQMYKWILSYDNVQEVRELYSEFNLYSFDLCYTAHEVKNGSELLTHSMDLIMPFPLVIGRPRSSDINIVSI